VPWLSYQEKGNYRLESYPSHSNRHSKRHRSAPIVALSAKTRRPGVGHRAQRTRYSTWPDKEQNDDGGSRETITAQGSGHEADGSKQKPDQ